MTNEEWYDKKIAPKLAELANQCGERGMSFLSVVEYEPGSRSRTQRLTNGAGLEMTDDCAVRDDCTEHRRLHDAFGEKLPEERYRDECQLRHAAVDEDT